MLIAYICYFSSYRSDILHCSCICQLQLCYLRNLSRINYLMTLRSSLYNKGKIGVDFFSPVDPPYSWSPYLQIHLLNLSVTPESVLVVLWQAFTGLCRAARMFSHLACMFPAEVGRGDDCYLVSALLLFTVCLGACFLHFSAFC